MESGDADAARDRQAQSRADAALLVGLTGAAASLGRANGLASMMGAFAVAGTASRF